MNIRRTAGILLFVGNGAALPFTGIAACESLGSIEGPDAQVTSDLGQIYKNPTGEHTQSPETEGYFDDTNDALQTGMLLTGVAVAEASLAAGGIWLTWSRRSS